MKKWNTEEEVARHIFNILDEALHCDLDAVYVKDLVEMYENGEAIKVLGEEKYDELIK